MQYQSGYLLQSVRNALIKQANDKDASGTNRTGLVKLNGLLRLLSTFEVHTDILLDNAGAKESLYAVATNILTRGLPTIPSMLVEDAFANAIGSTSKAVERGSIAFVLVDAAADYDFYQALHIIEPRYQIRREYINLDNVESNFERSFLLDLIPESDRFLTQLFERQRTRSSISPGHREGRVDFSLEIPYDLVATKSNRYNQTVNVRHHRNYIVEVDGARYHTDLHDDLKDFELGQFTSNVHHIREDSVYKDSNSLLESLKNEEFVNRTRQNNDDNLYLTNRATVLAIAPFAIARVQRMLLEYFLSKGPISKLKVAVLERDVPCGHVAIEDLTDLLHTLNELTSTPISLPDLSYEIFCSEEFMDHPLHGDIRPRNITALELSNFDLVLDVSVLRREGIFREELEGKAANVIRIRSSHYVHYGTLTGVLSAPAIQYRSLVNQLSNEIFQTEESVCFGLRKILQNIFRKLDFRDGQLPILSRALRQKSVIGLLPTGGGKSLTYQLAAMLQPGVTVVIDPIRSLMKDQFDGLREIGIDKCEFINSSLASEEKRYNQDVLLANGRLQFIFVSPERFVIEEFRTALGTAAANGHYFSYAVIDEVHCVSEWGHDFRTPYLNLGDNAQKFCLTCSGSPVPLFGLTATASFDVLADIERELAIQNDDGDAVVRFENSIRDEINYVFKEVPVALEEIDRVTEQEIRERVGGAKQKVLFDVLRSKEEVFSLFNDRSMLEKIARQSFDQYLPAIVRQQKIGHSGDEDSAKQDFISTMLVKLRSDDPFLARQENTGTNYGYGMIVFTPHRKGWLGIRNGTRSDGVFDKPGVVVSTPTNIGIAHTFDTERMGYFMGSGEDEDAARIDEESFFHLDQFKNSKCSLMIATKAFGMGIDKPDVRLTVHMNIPQSIESFVQEAGRGGRDGKVCTSLVLYNGNRFEIKKRLGESFHLDKEVLLYFHKNSFKGQMKERVVLYEFRNRIEYPNTTNRQLLTKMLNDLHGFGESQFKIARGRNGHSNRLFLSKVDGASMGYINLETGITDIYHDINNDILCRNAVHTLKQELVKVGFGDSQAIAAWMDKQVVNTHQEVGLERKLKEMAVGDTGKIIIPFTNAFLSEKNESGVCLNPNHQRKLESAKVIRDALESGVLDSLSFNNLVRQAIDSGDDYRSFVDSLPLNNETLDLLKATNSLSEELQRAYYAPRNQSDTAKAIYRLMSIGIIDEYTIDYAGKLYKVSFTKKEPLEYFNSLELLVRRYTSKNIARRELNSLRAIYESQMAYDKGSAISTCLEYLTNFIYDKIKEKRLQAINDMVRLCDTAIEYKNDPVAQNFFIKDEIYYYFNAKYTRRGFIETVAEGVIEASMPDDLENELGIDDTIRKYLSLVENADTGEFMSNLKHLRGSTMRMLRSNPEQPAYYILKSFSLFVIADSIKSLTKDAQDDFVVGLRKWKDLESNLDVSSFIAFFKAKLGEHVPIPEASFISIEDQFYTGYYSKWTSNFRNKIS